MPKKYYVAPIIKFWKELEFVGVPWPVGGFGSSVGAMMAYESLEDFKKDFPDREPLVMTKMGSNDNQHSVPQTAE